MKTCAVCEKELPSRRSRFCSDRCGHFYSLDRSKKRKLLLKKLYKPKNCIGCGKTFLPKTHDHKCCTTNCWNLLAAIKRKEKRLERRESALDKKEFDRKNTWGRSSGSGNKFANLDFKRKSTATSIGRTYVTSATFTKADSPERENLQKEVELYLKKGGKILRFGQQAPEVEEDIVPDWDVSETEEKVAIKEYEKLYAYNGD